MIKNIGILGMGKRSTDYLVDYVRDRNFSLVQSDFEFINSHLPDGWANFNDRLHSDLNQLINKECTHVILPNFTMNDHIERVIQHYDLSIQLIHPLDLIITEFLSKGIKAFTILGSKYTMSSNTLAERFGSNGITMHSPSDADVYMIDEYRKRLYAYTESPVDNVVFRACVEQYADKYPVVLACSELSIPDLGNATNPIYDLMELVADL